ncbi:MAG: hypothetical protein AAGI48_14360 [Verrucomicrobiota bacterium]
MILGLIVTFSSISLDLYQSCFIGMSYTSWWKNIVMLFPGFLIRKWAFHDLLPLFGVDVFSGTISFLQMASLVVFCGMCVCGLIWITGELVLARLMVGRAMNSALEADDDSGTSGGG